MPDATTIAVGAPLNDGGGTDAGEVRVFKWNGVIWVQKGNNIVGEQFGDHSGYYVCMPDSNTVAIGAILNDGNGTDAGHVRVYTWNGSSWVQKGPDIDGEAAGDNFGYSVSMPDTNTIAVGAPKNDGNGTSAGHVRVYKWNGTSWIQKGLDIDGEATADWSGYSLSMSDSNTLAIGAYNNGGNGISAGQVRVYRWDGTSWVQKGIDIDGEAAGNEFGCSVCMVDSNTFAAGAIGNNVNGSTAGDVRVFTWNGTTWIQKGASIYGEHSGDYSGRSVSMPDVNTIAIGSDWNSGNGYNAGHARVFIWNGTSWIQIGMNIEGEAEDYSGNSISMPDVNTLAIGAAGNDGNGLDAGDARVFKLRGISGRVYGDFNQDCIKYLETGLGHRYITIQPNNIIAQLDQYGVWHLDSLPAGNYTVIADTSGGWQSTCSATRSFTVVYSDSITVVPSIGLVNTHSCAVPDISIMMPTMIRCFPNQKVYVQVCNYQVDTGAIDNAYVIVELANDIVPISASMPYTNIGNNQLRFDIGTLSHGQCIDFNINSNITCAPVAGQTLCVKAKLFPTDSCIYDTIPTPYLGGVSPCSTAWDNSSLEVDGSCQNDSIIFTVTNSGAYGGGDMSCYAPVRLYIDGQLISVDSVMLVGGASQTFVYSGDGRTWRLEADQHPFHPGNSHPNASVELCGDSTNWTPGLVNVLSMDGANPDVDVYCSLVNGSHDPNDKTGFPIGVDSLHYIAPNEPLEYHIRFQNTGNGPAYRVVIRDTLDEKLDIFSVLPGVSSHPYRFTMYGPRVLQWTFDNIMLPDSTSDEPDSHGFVSFKVNQQQDLPHGTQIRNDADIYFDYNAPVITNNTLHTINDSLYIAPTPSIQNILDTICDEYIYNGVHYTQSGTYYQYISNSGGDSLLTIDVLVNHSSEYNYSETACNIYVLNGQSYDSSNVYQQLLITAKGCDSIINADLIILNSTTSSLSTANCYQFQAPSGKILTASGTYLDTIPNVVGCDSIITIDLTINSVDSSVTQSGIILSANENNAYYQWYDCSSNQIVSGATNQSYTPNQNGSYAVQVTGQNGCVDSSMCYTINSVGLIESNFDNDIIIYPNPTSGILKLDLGSRYDKLQVKVLTFEGKIVQSQQLSGQIMNLNLSELADGIYFIQLQSDEQRAVLRVVKEK